MKKLIVFLILLVTVVGFTTRSDADSITFNFDGIVSSSGITSIASLGTLTLTDSGNYVNLAVNLINPNFKILAIDLNFNDAKFSNSSTLSLLNQSMDIGLNAVLAGGYHGRFDIKIPANGNIGAWGIYTDTMMLNSGASQLGIADLLFKDTANSLFAAIHIGNYSQGSSVWAGATSVAVPEPATIIFLGLGLAGLALFGGKFKSTRANDHLVGAVDLNWTFRNRRILAA